MRLIDADALLEEYEAYGNTSPTALAFIDDLKEMPTVEARKHGHWTADNKCSVCGNPAPIDNRPIHKEMTLLKGIACPYCGAEMDEVEND